MGHKSNFSKTPEIHLLEHEDHDQMYEPRGSNFVSNFQQTRVTLLHYSMGRTYCPSTVNLWSSPIAMYHLTKHHLTCNAHSHTSWSSIMLQIWPEHLKVETLNRLMMNHFLGFICKLDLLQCLLFLPVIFVFHFDEFCSIEDDVQGVAVNEFADLALAAFTITSECPYSLYSIPLALVSISRNLKLRIYVSN